MQNQPVYVSNAPNVVVVQNPSADPMDRSNYAGDFSYSRGNSDCTLCGRSEIPNTDGEKFTVCCMSKGITGHIFEQEHPDLVIKTMDIGEISPMPTTDETCTCYYCFCCECACIMPNHDLCITDDTCLTTRTRDECNIGEADSCLKCSSTWRSCDFQRPDHCVQENCACRCDLLCCMQYKMEYTKGGGDCSCCKGQSKRLCCVQKYAIPTDEDVPCGLGCCGIICCGGKAKEQEPEGNTVVVVQN